LKNLAVWADFSRIKTSLNQHIAATAEWLKPSCA